MKKEINMSVNDYVLKIKAVSEALGSIGAPIEDDDLVSTVLNGLMHDDNWKAFSNSVNVRENLPNFDELISLMIIEERNIGGPSLGIGPSEQAQAFYSGYGRGIMVETRGDPRENVVQEEDKSDD